MCVPGPNPPRNDRPRRIRLPNRERDPFGHDGHVVNLPVDESGDDRLLFGRKGKHRENHSPPVCVKYRHAPKPLMLENPLCHLLRHPLRKLFCPFDNPNAIGRPRLNSVERFDPVGLFKVKGAGYDVRFLDVYSKSPNFWR